MFKFVFFSSVYQTSEFVFNNTYLPCNSTTTVPASVTNSQSNGDFYQIVKQSDMMYLVNNLISTRIEDSFLKCGIWCNRPSLACTAFVYNDVRQNCSIYKQLTSLLTPSLTSNVYFRNLI